MFKLMKYEFRKAWTAMLVLLGLTAALEAYFLGAMATENENHMIIAAMLLFFCVYAVAIFVLVRGVTSYSGELKSRSSYLIFMTPNSAIRIVGSKFLYTFVNAIFFAALYVLLGLGDYALLMHRLGALESALDGIKSLFRMQGVYVDQILLGAGAMVVYVFLSILSTIGIAYLAITLSHTWFRDKKWRWLPSLALFGAMSWGVNKINALLPSAVDHLVMVEQTYVAGTAEVEIVATAFSDLLPYLLPSAGVSLAVILISLVGCAALLEKKVNL